MRGQYPTKYLKSRLFYEYPLLVFDNLPCGHKVLRPDGDEIDSFLEGGEVELVGRPFQFLAKHKLTIQRGDFNIYHVRSDCFDCN